MQLPGVEQHQDETDDSPSEEPKLDESAIDELFNGDIDQVDDANYERLKSEFFEATRTHHMRHQVDRSETSDQQWHEFSKTFFPKNFIIYSEWFHMNLIRREIMLEQMEKQQFSLIDAES